MNTEKNLIEKICTQENALRSYQQARRAKRMHKDVLKFELDREANLEGIIGEIEDGSYTQGNYFIFKIYEPKERLIMSLPFSDRVAQHMICNVIDPIFDRRFIEHTYACRKGKGVHAASKQLGRWLYEMEIVQGKKALGYSGDIRQYFASIVHEILINEIRRYIGDRKLINILTRIIHHNGAYLEGKGDPVGNLTSQLFANVYLNVLDQYVLNVLKPEHYERYMDNFLLLDSDPDKILYARDEITEFLGNRLGLDINPKSTVVAARDGIDFVGYRHFPGYAIMRKSMTRRLNNLIRSFENEETDVTGFMKSYRSRIGHMKHADTYHLIQIYNERAKIALKEKEETK